MVSDEDKELKRHDVGELIGRDSTLYATALNKLSFIVLLLCDQIFLVEIFLTYSFYQHVSSSVSIHVTSCDVNG